MKKLTSQQLKRNKLVEDNMGLATYFARHFQASRMDYEDLVQESYMGLIDAAALYDAKRGTKFSTYARWRILKRVMDAIHNTNEIIKTPRRRPSYICEPLNRIDMEGLVATDPHVTEVLDDAEMVRTTHECIKNLPSREAIVIRMRHGINTTKLTLQQVGNILAVSAERVRQIQNAGEDKLRLLLSERAILRDYGAEQPGT